MISRNCCVPQTNLRAVVGTKHAGTESFRYPGYRREYRYLIPRTDPRILKINPNTYTFWTVYQTCLSNKYIKSDRNCQYAVTLSLLLVVFDILPLYAAHNCYLAVGDWRTWAAKTTRASSHSSRPSRTRPCASCWPCRSYFMRNTCCCL